MKYIYRFFLVIIIVVISIYIFSEVLEHEDDSYEYYTAKKITVENTIEMDCVVIMDDYSISYNGDFGYSQSSGSRIETGAKVIEYYFSDSDAELREILDENNAIYDLYASLLRLVSTNSSEYSASKILSISSILDELDDENLNTKYGSEYIIAKENGMVSAEQYEYIESMKNQYELIIESIYSQIDLLSGYNVDSDGYLLYYNSSATCNTFTIDDFYTDDLSLIQQYINSSKISLYENIIAKVSSSYMYNIVGVSYDVSNSSINNMNIGSEYLIRGEDESVSAELIDIVFIDSCVIFYFECEDLCSEIMSMSYGALDLVVEEITGLSVPTSALRLSNDLDVLGLTDEEVEALGENSIEYVKGVYIKYGSLLLFKRIDPIFEIDGYYIVPLNGIAGSNNEIVMYDSIVTSNLNIYNKQII